ncbi:porin family protein [Microbacteriaceae bacterium K1510]|nr:porin family protein [Microbacteriaceae bacterium K1510]
MRSFTALGAAVAVLGFATAASAADLPRREAMPAKAPLYAPVYNWTGFYVGVNLGGAWSDSNSNFGKASGVVGGGQIGYNWQAAGSPLVLGIEADIQGTSLKSSGTVDPVNGITGEAKVPAFGTVRARIGYAWDRFMVYGTGGWAYSDTKVSLTGPGGSISSDKWGSGWTAGGGVEWAFAGPWSVKAEYLYVKAKSVDLTLAGIPVSTGDYNYSVARLGLNYRF